MDSTLVQNNPALSPAAEKPVSPIIKWGSLAVLSLALAIIIIDTTILNVSLRTIINDLHTDILSIQWVITVYSLILAAFTITGGRLGDLFGRKKMFMLGAAIFAVGSFIASVSKSVGMLITGEAVIEGIGAILMMPATASLLVSMFRGRERAIAFGVWGGIAGASAAIGPILGGWLTTNYSWRWGFRINVGVAALLLLGSIIIKEAYDKEEKPSLDLVGVLLSSLGLLSMVFGFIKASTYGWLKAKEQLVLWGHTLDLGRLSVVPLFVLLGLLILGVFALWEKRMDRLGKTPLVSLNLLRNRQFTTGTITLAILSLGMSGLFFSLPVYMQAVRNLDAFHTGLALLPLAASALISAPLSSYFAKFVSPKRLVQLGLLLDIAAFIVLHFMLGPDITNWHLLPGLILFGLGMGLMNAQVSNLTLSAVSVEESGEASGVNNTFRQVGSTLGAAILGAILISSMTTNLNKGIENSAVLPSPIKQSIAKVFSDNASQIEFGSAAAYEGNIPQNIKDELSNIVKQGTTDANRTTLVYASLFLVLGFLASFALPGSKDIETETSVAASHSPIAEHEKTIRKIKYRSIAAIILLTAAAGIGGYLLAKNKYQKNDVPAAPVTATPQADQNVLPQSSQNGPSGNIKGAQTQIQAVAPRGEEQLPTDQPGTPAQYQNSSWAISFTTPGQWKNFIAKETTSDTLWFFDSQNNKIYGLIQKYPSAGLINLEMVKTALKGSADVSNISDVTFADLLALKYSSKTSGNNIAVIKDSTLYYLSGDIAASPAADSFRFE